MNNREERNKNNLLPHKITLTRLRTNNFYQTLDSLEKEKREQIFLLRYRKDDSKESFYEERELSDILNKIGRVDYHFKYIPYFAVHLDGKEAKTILDVIGNEARKRIMKKYAPIRSYVEYIEAPFQFTKAEFNPEKNREEISEIEIEKAQTERRWNLENILAYGAQIISRGEGTKIAIIDTGVDYLHPELKERFGSEKGIDFTGIGDPYDGEGHGTHVAGICAGASTGVATEATLYAVKALDDLGRGSDVNVIKGIEWAIDRNVDVINMSLGSKAATQALGEACDEAAKRNILLVAAAGNERAGASYPASFDSVISVAAVDSKNHHPDFSNIFETTEISAPGVDILSTFPNGGYCFMTGTSMSTPHISGVLSLFLSRANEYLQKKARFLLKDTALPLCDSNYYPPEHVFGAGLVQAEPFVGETTDFLSFRSKLSNQPPLERLKEHISERHEEMKKLYGEH